MRENEEKKAEIGASDFNPRKMNLFEKMAAITAELKTVAKNLEVKVSSNNKYNAVSERDILDAVKPMEEKYRIYSYPSDREILESETLTSENTYNGQTTTKTTFFTRIKTIYKFVDIDSPTDFITMVTFAEGIDPQDKGSGKAMTYADKYALMKAYKISTGDDPDQNPSEPENYQKQNQGNRQQSQPSRYQGPQQGWQEPPQKQMNQTPPPQKEIQKEPIICEWCHGEILDTTLKDGSIMNKEEVAEYSRKHFLGAVYCPNCQKELLQRNRESIVD